MSISKNIELRLILTQEDPLYHPFSEIKKFLGIKSNSEVLRFIIKQISKIPNSKLILDFMGKDSGPIKKIKSIKKEVFPFVQQLTLSLYPGLLKHLI